MAVSKEEFLITLNELFKGNVTTSQMVVDYMEKTPHEVSSADLYLAVNSIHGHEFAKLFTDYLEQNYNLKRAKVLHFGKTA